MDEETIKADSERKILKGVATSQLPKVRLKIEIPSTSKGKEKSETVNGSKNINKPPHDSHSHKIKKSLLSKKKRREKKNDDSVNHCRSLPAEDSINSHCSSLPAEVSFNMINEAYYKLNSLAENIESITKFTFQTLLQCKHEEINIRKINSLDSVVDMHNKLNSFVLAMESDVHDVRKDLKTYVIEWCRKLVKQDFQMKMKKKERVAKKTGIIPQTKKKRSKNDPGNSRDDPVVDEGFPEKVGKSPQAKKDRRENVSENDQVYPVVEEGTQKKRNPEEMEKRTKAVIESSDDEPFFGFPDEGNDDPVKDRVSEKIKRIKMLYQKWNEDVPSEDHDNSVPGNGEVEMKMRISQVQTKEKEDISENSNDDHVVEIGNLDERDRIPQANERRTEEVPRIGRDGPNVEQGIPEQKVEKVPMNETKKGFVPDKGYEDPDKEMRVPDEVESISQEKDNRMEYITQKKSYDDPVVYERGTENITSILQENQESKIDASEKCLNDPDVHEYIVPEKQQRKEVHQEVYEDDYIEEKVSEKIERIPKIKESIKDVTRDCLDDPIVEGGFSEKNGKSLHSNKNRTENVSENYQVDPFVEDGTQKKREAQEIEKRTKAVIESSDDEFFVRSPDKGYNDTVEDGVTENEERIKVVHQKRMKDVLLKDHDYCLPGNGEVIMKKGISQVQTKEKEDIRENSNDDYFVEMGNLENRDELNYPPLFDFAMNFSSDDEFFVRSPDKGYNDTVEDGVTENEERIKVVHQKRKEDVTSEDHDDSVPGNEQIEMKKRISQVQTKEKEDIRENSNDDYFVEMGNLENRDELNYPPLFDFAMNFSSDDEFFVRSPDKSYNDTVEDGVTETEERIKVVHQKMKEDVTSEDHDDSVQGNEQIKMKKRISQVQTKEKEDIPENSNDDYFVEMGNLENRDELNYPPLFDLEMNFSSDDEFFVRSPDKGYNDTVEDGVTENEERIKVVHQKRKEDVTSEDHDDSVPGNEQIEMKKRISQVQTKEKEDIPENSNDDYFVEMGNLENRDELNYPPLFDFAMNFSSDDEFFVKSPDKGYNDTVEDGVTKNEERIKVVHQKRKEDDLLKDHDYCLPGNEKVIMKKGISQVQTKEKEDIPENSNDDYFVEMGNLENRDELNYPPLFDFAMNFSSDDEFFVRSPDKSYNDTVEHGVTENEERIKVVHQKMKEDVTSEDHDDSVQGNEQIKMKKRISQVQAKKKEDIPENSNDDYFVEMGNLENRDELNYPPLFDLEMNFSSDDEFFVRSPDKGYNDTVEDGVTENEERIKVVHQKRKEDVTSGDHDDSVPGNEQIEMKKRISQVQTKEKEDIPENSNDDYFVEMENLENRDELNYPPLFDFAMNFSSDDEFFVRSPDKDYNDTVKDGVTENEERIKVVHKKMKEDVTSEDHDDSVQGDEQIEMKNRISQVQAKKKEDIPKNSNDDYFVEMGNLENRDELNYPPLFDFAMNFSSDDEFFVRSPDKGYNDTVEDGVTENEERIKVVHQKMKEDVTSEDHDDSVQGDEQIEMKNRISQVQAKKKEDIPKNSNDDYFVEMGNLENRDELNYPPLFDFAMNFSSDDEFFVRSPDKGYNDTVEDGVTENEERINVVHQKRKKDDLLKDHDYCLPGNGKVTMKKGISQVQTKEKEDISENINDDHVLVMGNLEESDRIPQANERTGEVPRIARDGPNVEQGIPEQKVEKEHMNETKKGFVPDIEMRVPDEVESISQAKDKIMEYITQKKGYDDPVVYERGTENITSILQENQESKIDASEKCLNDPDVHEYIVPEKQQRKEVHQEVYEDDYIEEKVSEKIKRIPKIKESIKDVTRDCLDVPVDDRRLPEEVDIITLGNHKRKEYVPKKGNENSIVNDGVSDIIDKISQVKRNREDVVHDTLSHESIENQVEKAGRLYKAKKKEKEIVSEEALDNQVVEEKAAENQERILQTEESRQKEKKKKLRNSFRSLHSDVSFDMIHAAYKKLNGFVEVMEGIAELTTETLLECKNKKINYKYINSFDSVLDMYNKLKSFVLTFESNVYSVRSGLEKYVVKWCKEVVKEDLWTKGKKKEGLGEKIGSIPQAIESRKEDIPDKGHDNPAIEEGIREKVERVSHAREKRKEEVLEKRHNVLEEGNEEETESIFQVMETTKEVVYEKDPNQGYSFKSLPTGVGYNMIHAAYCKLNRFVTDIDGIIKLSFETLLKFKKKKINEKHINSPDSVVDMCNKLKALVLVLESDVHLLREELEKYVISWCREVVKEDLKLKEGTPEKKESVTQGKEKKKEDVPQNVHDDSFNREGNPEMIKRIPQVNKCRKGDVSQNGKDHPIVEKESAEIMETILQVEKTKKDRVPDKLYDDPVVEEWDSNNIKRIHLEMKKRQEEVIKKGKDDSFVEDGTLQKLHHENKNRKEDVPNKGHDDAVVEDEAFDNVERINDAKKENITAMGHNGPVVEEETAQKIEKKPWTKTKGKQYVPVKGHDNTVLEKGARGSKKIERIPQRNKKIMEDIPEKNKDHVIEERAKKSLERKLKIKEKKNENVPEKSHQNRNTNLKSTNSCRSLPAEVSCNMINEVYYKLNSFTKDIEIITKVTSQTLLQCKNKQINIRKINSLDSMVDMHNKLNSFVLAMESDVHDVRQDLKKYVIEWCRKLVKQDFQMKMKKKERVAKQTGIIPLTKKKRSKNDPGKSRDDPAVDEGFPEKVGKSPKAKKVRRENVSENDQVYPVVEEGTQKKRNPEEMEKRTKAVIESSDDEPFFGFPDEGSDDPVKDRVSEKIKRIKMLYQKWNEDVPSEDHDNSVPENGEVEMKMRISQVQTKKKEDFQENSNDDHVVEIGNLEERDRIPQENERIEEVSVLKDNLQMKRVMKKRVAEKVERIPQGKEKRKEDVHENNHDYSTFEDRVPKNLEKIFRVIKKRKLFIPEVGHEDFVEENEIPEKVERVPQVKKIRKETVPETFPDDPVIEEGPQEKVESMPTTYEMEMENIPEKDHENLVVGEGSAENLEKIPQMKDENHHEEDKNLKWKYSCKSLPTDVSYNMIHTAYCKLNHFVAEIDSITKLSYDALMECKHKKINDKNINSIDSFLDMYNNLNSFVLTIESDVHDVRKDLKKYVIDWCRGVVKEDLEMKRDKRKEAGAKIRNISQAKEKKLKDVPKIGFDNPFIEVSKMIKEIPQAKKNIRGVISGKCHVDSLGEEEIPDKLGRIPQAKQNRKEYVPEKDHEEVIREEEIAEKAERISEVKEKRTVNVQKKGHDNPVTYKGVEDKAERISPVKEKRMEDISEKCYDNSITENGATGNIERLLLEKKRKKDFFMNSLDEDDEPLVGKGFPAMIKSITKTKKKRKTDVSKKHYNEPVLGEWSAGKVEKIIETQKKINNDEFENGNDNAG